MKQTGQKHSIELRVGIIVGILLILYIGISLFFINHYYFGTTLNGMNYGGKSLKQVRKSIVSEMEHYELTLVGRDQGSDVIAGSAIGLEYGFDNTLEQLLQSQKEFSWPIAIWKDHDYELPQMIAYQQQALEEQMQRLSFFDREEPAQDASILPYSAKTGTYELKKEKQGTTLDKEKTLIAIEEAIHSLDETLDLDKENCYVQPKILAADPSFLKIKDTLNQYVSSVIQYDFLQEEKAIHGEQISQWITYDAESVTIDDAKVREYVDAFASQYDTYGRNKLFTTQDGRELKLPSAYGWRLDRVAETRQLMADIQAGKSLIREPIYLYRGYARDAEGGDIGQNYVEIDLSAQHLYVHQAGQVTEESDFVSGNLAKGHATPAGIYGLTYKERDATLRGETYESHVDYWMPFNGNIGMHDAGWRKEFGGDIYLTKGSHGCVNLPTKKAERIYELVEKGMPVICYY